MKALFSNPPWWIEDPDAIYTPDILAGVRAGSRWPFTMAVNSRPGVYAFGDYLPYPFFLGAAATYAARETGAQVAFRDSLALRESYESYFGYLKSEDFDYIFIESASPSWEHDASLIRRIASVAPRSKVVVTGPIASMGVKILAENPVHALIQGEYEKGGVKVLNGAEGLLGYDLLTEEELNAAPYPYYDAAHAYRYWDSNPKGQCSPQLQVLSSRGCPYRCIFCVWPAVMTNNDPDGTGKRVVRQHSADYMEGMLTELVGRYGYRTIYFDDDTFNLGDRHVRDMCAVMTRIGLPWSAMCRADTISRDTWKIMRESGCFGVKIGFESGNQWVVDNIVRKSLDLEAARETVIHLKELGFTVHGTFTVGLPGETPEQMADTVRYRESLPLDSFQQSGTAEIEGSPLSTLRKTGRLDKYAGANLDGYIGERDGTRKIWRMELEGVTLDQAKVCREKGQPALAEAICRHLLEENGQDVAVLLLLGVIAAEARRFEQAARYFGRAIRLQPAFRTLFQSMDRVQAEYGMSREETLQFIRSLKKNTMGDVVRPHGSHGTLPPGGTANRAGPAEKEESPAQARSQDGAGADVVPAEPESRRAPRLIVLDHGMRFVAGHHFTYNFGLLFECIKSGMDAEFYVHWDCQQPVVDILKAKPVLNTSPYISYSSDEHCDYLEDFLVAADLTTQCLMKNLTDVEPQDIVFAHTAVPKTALGIANWYLAIPEEQRPHLCLKFQHHGFVHVSEEYKALVKSIFRLALKPVAGLEKVRLAASNKVIAKQIELISGARCAVFPVPLQVSHPGKYYRGKAEKGELVIGYAGEGRGEQGVYQLPGIIEKTIRNHPNAKFLVQLGCNFTGSTLRKKLRSYGDRVVFIDKCLVGDDFLKLIAGMDALLLPYDPGKYMDRCSQIVVEAIALGVTPIVPAGTSLAFEAKEAGCGYSIIEEFTAESAATAVCRFIEDHDELAQRSVRAAGRYKAFHSGKQLMRMLLETCEVQEGLYSQAASF